MQIVVLQIEALAPAACAAAMALLLAVLLLVLVLAALAVTLGLSAAPSAAPVAAGVPVTIVAVAVVSLLPVAPVAARFRGGLVIAQPKAGEEGEQRAEGAAAGRLRQRPGHGVEAGPVQPVPPIRACWASRGRSRYSVGIAFIYSPSRRNCPHAGQVVPQ